MKNKIYNVVLIILAILLLIVIALICIKYTNNQVTEKELGDVVQETKIQFQEISQIDNKPISIEYKGYNVVGIIKIPSINIEYPIIDKTNEQSMKISITKFWGCNVNEIGNFTMAGHNNLDGTMFGKTKKLEIGDTIEMTDLTGKTIVYEIFSKYVIDPNDVECVKSVEEDTREITLITCTNGRKNRLIIKAREII